jgi:hypothetical protein
VHASGYFVSAESVFSGRPDDVEVTLVLDPGLKTQRPLMARVVRRDKDLGLALLHADGAKDLPNLRLGSADKLSELVDLVNLGYPTGVPLDKDKPEYPAVVVDVGTVTSLGKKDGELTAITMKGGPTVFFQGGPALDENGAVAGVLIASSSAGSRAVPVNRLARFLAAPNFQFAAPTLTRANEHEPAEFQVCVVSVLPPAKPLKLELVLRAGEESERRFPMELKDGTYRVSAVPAPKEKVRRLELSAQFETGAITGVADDREIQVGGQKVQLSAVKRLQFQPKPMAVLADGKTLEGAMSGLDKVALAFGGQTVAADLSKATSVQVFAQKPAVSVDCTIIAKLEDTEVGRHQARLLVRGASLVEPADLSGTGIVPAKLGEEKVVKKLPDIASEIRVGGGGRYLVLHLPKLKKLAIFDVNEASIVRYIPLAEDKVVYAAGLDKIVVGLTAKGVIESWDLNTGEKIASRALAGAAEVTSVLMGFASHGPVVVNGAFYDLDSLKPLPIKTPHGYPPPWSPVSADGTVFGAWKTNQSPAESISLVLQGDELKRYDEGGVGHVVPGPDGRVVYTAAGVRTNQLKSVAGAPKAGYSLPSAEGNFFLTVSAAEGSNPGGLAVYMLGQEQPLVKDAGVKHGVHFDGWDREMFGPWKRIYFIPRAKVIVVFPDGNDRLELYPFDVEAALEKSGLDYLLVSSRPTTTAKRGAEYTYQITAKSKKGDVKYHLSAGPPGMEVSPTGQVKWRVPLDFKAGEADVLITARDASGQEAFHTFTIRLGDG